MQYEELTLADDFLFSKVMQDKEICKKLLEMILDIKIRDLVYHREQQILEDAPDAKGVRLDVYVEDENNTVFDLEMQATNRDHLPKRSRYYQGRIDVSILDKGVDTLYRDLMDSYVIFICLHDIFNQGRHYYRFENLCVDDPTIRLKDGAVKIFLIAGDEMQDVNGELAGFLRYLKTGAISDDFTRAVDESVRFARRNKDWKEEYRVVNLLEREWKGMGREEGLAEGREEGLAEGREEGRMAVLFKYVANGYIPPEVAAEELNMSVDDLKKALIEAGYKFPNA
ncbi:MAG: Rpn family recombination-promoting nuclease/putative transposase [Ruminococcus sp.]|nr:Rpn family recombination-promoting nuclease/putative transposase [Ruminococcus sp.]